MSKKQMYQNYLKNFNSYGQPVCFDEWLNNEFANIELQDDGSPYGGISHIGETLGEFLSEIGRTVYDNLKSINHDLRVCGIRGI